MWRSCMVRGRFHELPSYRICAPGLQSRGIIRGQSVLSSRPRQQAMQQASTVLSMSGPNHPRIWRQVAGQAVGKGKLSTAAFEQCLAALNKVGGGGATAVQLAGLANESPQPPLTRSNSIVIIP